MKKIDTPFNILYSYAYYNPKFVERLVEAQSKGTINVMIDSGAFTAYNAVSKKITLADYCDFLKDIDPYIEKAVMLDVIGDAEASKRNYEKMVSCGLTPMYVATMFDNDFDYIKSTLNVCEDLCVAGGATTKGPWMIKRFQDIYYKTGERARIHGLAFVIDSMFRVPIVSVDCSSYSIAGRYGWLMYWGDYKVDKVWYKHVLAGKKSLDAKAIRALEEVGVTPEIFYKQENNKGAVSICKFIAEIAYIRYQIFCKANGIDFFLAVGGMEYLEDFLWIIDNYYNLSYQKYLEERVLK